MFYYSTAGRAMRRTAIGLGAALLLFSTTRPSLAEPISSNALQQISALIADKANRTPAQLKLDSQLIYALKASRNQPMAPGVNNLQFLPVATNGLVKVDIEAVVSQPLIDFIIQAGGNIISSVPKFNAVRAQVPLALTEQLAARADVRFIEPAAEPHLNTGSVNTEGDVTETAALARATFGVDGSGVKVGVLSDSVDFISGSQSTGDLPPNVTVLPGQSGVPGSGEGTAMLEIIHDVAPGAQLFYATAFGGAASFAQNILNLRAAGCDIIVDDVFYFTEAALQDGVVARAVNTVTADGALFFSACGNAGNKAHGTSSVWEGDFADGGPVGAPVNGRNGNIHSFGGATYSTVTSPGGGVYLFWADPLGASTNDYDLFVLDSTGNTVLGASTTAQTGAQSGFEGLNGNLAVGLRVVVVKVSGDTRFLHLDAILGQLQDNTTGWARGHAAATNAFSTAAIDVAIASPSAFVGGPLTRVEDFTSDGPRRMFFQGDGTPITPNDFTSTGGSVRQYPVIAASDGVSTSVPGFNPFFGTSAAAPHAAAICALLKSYNPSLTTDEIRNVITSTALDIEAPGVDVVSGYGAVMALPALQAAPLGINLVVLTNYLTGGNGNALVDFNECNDLDIVLVNRGISGATNVQATLSTLTPGVTIAQRASPYPNIDAQASATNVIPFKISTAPTFVCGTPVIVSMVVKSDQGSRTNILQFLSGTNGAVARFDSGAPVPIPDNSPAGIYSPIVVSNIVGAIGEVSVSLYITHTFDADLSLVLVAPDGTTNLLSGNNGSFGDNYGFSCAPDNNRTIFSDRASTPIGASTAPFLGSFKPEQSFSVYNGKSGTNVNGTWRLHVTDSAAIDIGNIECWSLYMSPTVCSDGGGQCPGVDLSIGMTPAPEPVFVGSNLVYTIRVTNAGPDTAKSTVISHLLPASVVFVSATVSQGSISHSGGAVTATLGNLPAGGVAVATVTVTPTVPALLTSTATVSSANPEFDPSNNSVTAISHVNPPFSDLAIGLFDSPDPVLVNQTLTYSVSVTNRGPSIASGVTVTNVLSPTMGIISVLSSQGFSSVNGSVVTLSFGSIPSGAVATATISANPTLEGSYTATATATANQIDPVLNNNSATVSTVVGPSTDLAVAIVDSPDPVVLRSNLTYVISFTNRGPSVATSVTVNDTLPTGVGVVSMVSTLGSIGISGNTVTANLGTLTNGATGTITIVVASTNAGTLVNSVNISGAQSDPNLANNSASATTVVAAPFVSIAAAGATLTAESVSPPNGTVDVGETVTVQLRLRNAGNVANTNLVATLLATNGVTAPSGPQTYATLAPSGFPVARSFTFTASGTNGGTVLATLQLQDGAANLGTVTFAFGLPNVLTFSNTNRIDVPTTLQDQQMPGPAAPYPSTIAVSGVNGLVGKVSATVHNLTHSYPHDLNLLVVAPSGVATLLMTDAGEGAPVSSAEITFDESAASPLPASGQITSGSYQSSAYDVAAPFTNPAPAGPYSTSLSAFNGPSPNGSWALYANDDSTGDFGNIAGGWSLRFTTLSPVNQVADLAVTSTSSSSSVLVGNNVTNRFVLVNNGPNNVAAAAFTNTIPANASLVSVSVSQGSFVTNGNTLVFNVGGLASGSNAIVTIVLSPTSAGSVTNAAVVASASGEIDLNLSNNSSAPVVNAALPQTDIAVSQIVTPNPVTTGSNFTTSITVTNTGSNNALNVVVSNTLPAGVNFVNGAVSQGTFSFASGTLVGSLGTVAPGASATVDFTVTATAVGSLTNLTRVSTLSVDGNSGNNDVSTIVTVANPAPVIAAAGATLISESFSPANAAVEIGETVTVSLTLTNSGLANTANLVATLLAGDGVTAPSAPANYGVLIHGGAAVSRNFTFTAGAASGGVINATLQLQDGANNLGTANFAFVLPATTAFSNSLAITIPDHGPATPYPSTIAVSGLTGLVSKVSVTLKGLTHGFPDDVDVMLVSPSGQKVMLMSDVGGGHPVSNVDLTIDDSASIGLPDSAQLSTGTFRATDFEPGDSFPSPVGAGVPASTLSAFNGTTPNGNWSLFVVDDSNGDAGNIAGGWSLAVTTVTTVGPAVNLITTITDSPDPVFVGSLLTYTITLTNAGPSAATVVLLTDSLPPGLTLVSSNTSSGSFSLIGGGVTINAGSLASGAGLVATLRVTASTPGVISNFVSAASAQTDLDPVSNTAKALTAVLSPQAAQLAISAVIGQQYQITVTGEPGQTYRVEGGTNLTSWTPIYVGTAAPNGTFKFNTTNAQSFNFRFFRSVRIP